ncbi:MAG: HD domain-containing protein [Desulfosarcina sp.]|nr:HD domain-containing protein [Desulfobacterales bacterium]
MPNTDDSAPDAGAILKAYYRPGSKIYDLLQRHGEQVGVKARRAAGRVSHLKPDLDFIGAAALLHDIGIFLTQTPQLGCHGRYPYICHGYLGRQLLEDRGLPRHALVCERHVGVGITVEDIRTRNLPLPARDMRPVTIEEKLVCYADKFYSKTNGHCGREKTFAEIVHKLKKYSRRQSETFIRWAGQYEGIFLNADGGRTAPPQRGKIAF